MCGIFAYSGELCEAGQLVLKGLKQLEYRGYDSWGVTWLPSTADELVVEKSVGKIGTSHIADSHPAGLALGHTRWATHGGVTVANAHPHLNQSKTLAIVHNGIVENYQSLKIELLRKGYIFSSETDTEVVLHLLEENLKDTDLLHAAQKTFSFITGLNAVVVVYVPTQEIIAFRNGSPLVFGKNTQSNLLASDSIALSEYCHSAYFLEDGDLLQIKNKKALLYTATNLHRKKIRMTKLEFGISEIEVGNYSSYLAKEIAEQPQIILHAADQLGSQIKKYAKTISNDLILVGCGTAYHAALLGTYYFARITHLQVAAMTGSEFYTWRGILDATQFVIFLSQSGETIEITEHLPYLQATHIPYGAIVNRVGSTLERTSTIKIMLGVGPEQSVLATKSYSAKVIALFLLAHEYVGTIAYAKKLLRLSSVAAEAVLAATYVKKHISPLAKILAKQTHIFIIGRGLTYPLALEAALKLKEATYIHAEAFAAGELKHGAIALIEKGTPCIVFTFDDELDQTIISSAMEVKSRGAFVIGIGSNHNTVFDYFIPITNVGELTILPAIIVIQILTLHIALLLGNDPDKPRNLAKSVTVR